MRIKMLGIVVAGFGLGFAGCGKKGPDLVEVCGTLTLRGKPFPNVTLNFLPHPETGQLSPSSTGVTDEDGHYELFCPAVGKPGALIGKHEVVVLDPEALTDPPPLPGAEPEPSPPVEKKGLRYSPKYLTPHQTPLHVVVDDSGPQVIDLNVE